MNYLLDKKTVFKNQDKEKNGLSLTLVVILIITLLVVGGIIFPSLSRPVVAVANPLFTANTGASSALANVWSFFKTKKSLVRENVELSQANRVLQAKLFAANTKLADLSEINKLISTERATDYVLGRVTARPVALPYDVMLVSMPVELSESIEVADMVTWPGNILLGQVVQVGSGNAKIKLYSSPGIKKRALLGDEKVQSVLVGKGGGNFTISLPRGVDVRKGARIYLPDYPEFVVAIVGEIEKKPENPFQTIYAKTPVNINTLEWVEINAI